MANYTFIYEERNDDYLQYPDVEYPKDKRVTFNFEMDSATRWDNVMLEFAKFLDAVGYVGVSDKVQQRCDDEWEFLHERVNKALDEDTSNTGLSD